MLSFYKFIKNIDIIKIVAKIFHTIYGINNLADVLFNSFDSQYKNNELINTIKVSIRAKKGLFNVKNKKEKI